MHQQGEPGTDASVGARVRALREKLGLTQEKLADHGGLQRTEVVRVENGYNQATSARIRGGLARGFGLSLESAYAYLDGAIDLQAAFALSSRRPAEGAPCPS